MYRLKMEKKTKKKKLQFLYYFSTAVSNGNHLIENLNITVQKNTIV